MKANGVLRPVLFERTTIYTIAHVVSKKCRQRPSKRGLWGNSPEYSLDSINEASTFKKSGEAKNEIVRFHCRAGRLFACPS